MADSTKVLRIQQLPTNRCDSGHGSEPARVEDPKRPCVRRACVHCQRAHKRCSLGRPCQRCTELGLTCIDPEPKVKANLKGKRGRESTCVLRNNNLPVLLPKPSPNQHLQQQQHICYNNNNHNCNPPAIHNSMLWGNNNVVPGCHGVPQHHQYQPQSTLYQQPRQLQQIQPAYQHAYQINTVGHQPGVVPLNGPSNTTCPANHTRKRKIIDACEPQKAGGAEPPSKRPHLSPLTTATTTTSGGDRNNTATYLQQPLLECPSPVSVNSHTSSEATSFSPNTLTDQMITDALGLLLENAVLLGEIETAEKEITTYTALKAMLLTAHQTKSSSSGCQTHVPIITPTQQQQQPTFIPEAHTESFPQFDCSGYILPTPIANNNTNSAANTAVYDDATNQLFNCLDVLQRSDGMPSNNTCSGLPSSEVPTQQFAVESVSSFYSEAGVGIAVIDVASFSKAVFGDLSVDGVRKMSLQSGFSGCNESFASMLGTNVQEVMASSWGSVIPRLDEQRFASLCQLFHSTDFTIASLPLYHKNGDLVVCAVNVHNLRDESGMPTFAVCHFWPIQRAPRYMASEHLKL